MPPPARMSERRGPDAPSAARDGVCGVTTVRGRAGAATSILGALQASDARPIPEAEQPRDAVEGCDEQREGGEEPTRHPEGNGGAGSNFLKARPQERDRDRGRRAQRAEEQAAEENH